jgi:hypothetical protein
VINTKLRALLVGALFAFQATAAHAVVVITDDGGGIITEFEQRYAALKAAGERVIIDGTCASACTLFLNITPVADVCITPRARLGFHSAAIRKSPWEVEYSEAGTDMVYKAYPQPIKALLREKGWSGGELEGWKEGRLIWLESSDLKPFYRSCDPQDFDHWHIEVPVAAPETWLQRFLRWIASL